VISRLISNTPAGLNLDLIKLGTLLMPFVVVLGAIIVAGVPGVLEWGGGIFKSMMSLVGL